MSKIILLILVCILNCWGCSGELDTDEQEEIIIISNDNWREYFEYNEEIKFHKDESGNVIGVYLEAFISLKEDVESVIDKNNENRVYFTARHEVVGKEYIITDSSLGEWKYTGYEYDHKPYYDGHISMEWNSKKIPKATLSLGGCFTDINGNTYMEVSEEFEMIKVQGSLRMKE